MTNEERAEKLVVDITGDKRQASSLASVGYVLSFADEIRRECNKERDQYKTWWEGATETHTQLRKLYDDQNARMWAILKRPECPEGLAQRMLKMPEADQDYFLSLAVESTAYADEIRRECAEMAVAWQVKLCTDDDWTCERCTECNQLRYAIIGNDRG